MNDSSSFLQVLKCSGPMSEVLIEYLSIEDVVHLMLTSRESLRYMKAVLKNVEQFKSFPVPYPAVEWSPEVEKSWADRLSLIGEWLARYAPKISFRSCKASYFRDSPILDDIAMALLSTRSAQSALETLSKFENLTSIWAQANEQNRKSLIRTMISLTKLCPKIQFFDVEGSPYDPEKGYESIRIIDMGDLKSNPKYSVKPRTSMIWIQPDADIKLLSFALAKDHPQITRFLEIRMADEKRRQEALKICARLGVYLDGNLLCGTDYPWDPVQYVVEKCEVIRYLDKKADGASDVTTIEEAMSLSVIRFLNLGPDMFVRSYISDFFGFMGDLTGQRVDFFQTNQPDPVYEKVKLFYFDPDLYSPLCLYSQESYSPYFCGRTRLNQQDKEVILSLTGLDDVFLNMEFSQLLMETTLWVMSPESEGSLALQILRLLALLAANGSEIKEVNFTDMSFRHLNYPAGSGRYPNDEREFREMDLGRFGFFWVLFPSLKLVSIESSPQELK